MKLSIQPRKVLAALLAIVVPGWTWAPAYAQILPTTSTSVVSPGSLHQKFSGTGSGSLTAADEKGKPLGNCPLKHTDV